MKGIFFKLQVSHYSRCRSRAVSPRNSQTAVPAASRETTPRRHADPTSHRFISETRGARREQKEAGEHNRPAHGPSTLRRAVKKRDRSTCSLFRGRGQSPLSFRYTQDNCRPGESPCNELRSSYRNNSVFSLRLPLFLLNNRQRERERERERERASGSSYLTNQTFFFTLVSPSVFANSLQR